jgi:hypothetical protein
MVAIAGPWFDSRSGGRCVETEAAPNGVSATQAYASSPGRAAGRRCAGQHPAAAQRITWQPGWRCGILLPGARPLGAATVRPIALRVRRLPGAKPDRLVPAGPARKSACRRRPIRSLPPGRSPRRYRAWHRIAAWGGLSAGTASVPGTRHRGRDPVGQEAGGKRWATGFGPASEEHAPAGGTGRESILGLAAATGDPDPVGDSTTARGGGPEAPRSGPQRGLCVGKDQRAGGTTRMGGARERLGADLRPASAPLDNANTFRHYITMNG